MGSRGDDLAGETGTGGGGSVRARLRRFLRAGSGFDRAIVAVVTAAIAVSWVLTVERVRFEESNATTEALRQATNLAVAAEQHALSTLEDVEQTVELVAREYTQRGAPPRLQELFDRGAVATGLYKVFVIANENGDFVAGSRPFAPTNVADREYFRYHKLHGTTGIVVNPPVVGRISGGWIIPVSRRIDKPDGSFGGVVVGSIEPSYFSDFYRKLDVGEHGVINLVGLDGISRVRRVGEVVEFAKDLRDTPFFANVHDRPTGTLLGPGGVDGVRRYISYRTFGRYALAINVGLSEADVLREFSVRKATYYASAGIASVALALVAAGFIAAARHQRRVNEALRRNDARLRATFDEAAVGIIHVGLDLRFVRANPKFCEMVGYSEAELRELTIADITHPDDRVQSDALCDRLLAADGGSSPSLEKRYLRKDGSVTWVAIAAAIARDQRGRPDYFITIVQDINARKEAQQLHRATFDQAAVGIAFSSVDGHFLQVNGQLAEMLGCAPADVAGGSVFDFIAPEHRDAMRDELRKVVAEKLDSTTLEFQYLRKGGGRGWVIRSLSPVRDAVGRIEYCISVVQDITERKIAEQALRESKELFDQLVSHIPEAFWIMDVERNELLYLSPAYERVCGVRFRSLSEASRNWLDVVDPKDRAQAIAAVREMRTEMFDQRLRIVRPDGAIRWVHLRGFPVQDASGRVYRVAGTIEDTTEHQLLVDQLQYRAHYDALTHLPNRVLCSDRLNQTLKQARRKRWLAAVLFLDLDRFKLVNDTLGHIVGDQLLRLVSKRLVTCVRAGDTVGRLGGDEFAIVLCELAQSQDAGLIAQKVLDSLAEPFDLDGHEVFVTASIGIATHPGDGDDAETLLKNADAAMFSAKNLGKNNYQFYTAQMNERALERLMLESNLRRALERDEFVLHLQPKANIATGRIDGCEALLRWRVPGNGLVAPAQFIPLLEESGLIVSVGEWVIRSACEQLRTWQDAGIAPVPIAVNLSAKQLQHYDICSVVERALRDCGVDASLLELEVTEGTAMHNAEKAIVTLGKLKALGVRISIDDFGTGYSSLSYLKRFPVDSLKLDRSFVKDLPADAEDAAIARAVINLAHSLDLDVIAEGVETESQLAFLAANGCDAIQGYYYARPLPVDQFTQWLTQRPRLRLPAAPKPVEAMHEGVA